MHCPRAEWAGLFGAKLSLMTGDWLLLETPSERAELEYNCTEAARQEWIREQTSRHDAAFRTHQDEVAHHNSQCGTNRCWLAGPGPESVQYFLELVAVQDTPA